MDDLIESLPVPKQDGVEANIVSGETGPIIGNSALATNEPDEINSIKKKNDLRFSI